MKNSSLITHLALALVLSFGFSLAVWVGLRIFDPAGFWIASLAAGLVGTATGFAAKRNLAITAAVTLVLRLAIFFMATSS